MKEDVPGVHEIPACKLLQVRLVVAAAFRLCGTGSIHFICEQAFDGSADRIVIIGLGGQMADRDRPLAQQLADRCKLRARPACDLDRDAVDGDGHERTGSLALVRGERTIW